MMANFSMSVSKRPKGLSVCEIKRSRDLRAISEAPGVFGGWSREKVASCLGTSSRLVVLVVSVVRSRFKRRNPLADYSHFFLRNAAGFPKVMSGHLQKSASWGILGSRLLRGFHFAVEKASRNCLQ
jgi:hypothetical protein